MEYQLQYTSFSSLLEVNVLARAFGAQAQDFSLDNKSWGGVTFDTMEDIRSTIKDLTKQKGSIRKVAKDLGMDHANLLRLLREDANPGLKTIEWIADHFGYDIKLVRRKEVKPSKSSRSRRKLKRR